MQTVTRYKAYNGNEFSSAEACEKYERDCREADEIISQLPPTPKDDGCNFANGGGYIQHDRANFLKVRKELLELANRLIPHKWFDQSLADETAHASWAGRMIDECSNEQLRKAWYRIMCTDSQFREWGQPYYAKNPEQASGQFQIN